MKQVNKLQIERLSQQIIKLESKLMIEEKIVEETYRNEKQTYNLLANDFNKLQQENQKLENQLHRFYEKIGEVDYLSGLVTKYKEIICPSDQALAFKKEQEQLLQIVFLQKQTIKKLTEEKEKLLKINVHMKEEVQKQKDEVRNMTFILNNPDILNGSLTSNADNQPCNILDDLQQHQPAMSSTRQQNQNTSCNIGSSFMNMNSSRNLNTTLNFLKMQRKIIRQEDDNQIHSSNSEISSDDVDYEQLNILFPDKVEKIKTDQKIRRVPYLNMVKVRQIMAKRESKMRKELQAENNHKNPTDKIIKLETELEITRKQLTNQTLKFRTMSDELKYALRVNEQIINRNQLIQRSNENLRILYENIYKDYQLVQISSQKCFISNLEQKPQKSVDGMKEYNYNSGLAQNMLERVFKNRKVVSRCHSEEKS